ncbi:hypothetical protein [uncultured Maribacter sp.]|uniref:hypothetical protein n=1 Tax=uncultured Maribacter sp. TaxID=431308 RepID=UPI002623200A|nr:hypothetical protein [uncultured Maribacter sp.]
MNGILEQLSTIKEGELDKYDRLKKPLLYVKKYCLDKLNQLFILSRTITTS